MFKSNEAKEVLYATFSKCLERKEQFSDSLLEVSNPKII